MQMVLYTYAPTDPTHPSLDDPTHTRSRSYAAVGAVPRRYLGGGRGVAGTTSTDTISLSLKIIPPMLGFAVRRTLWFGRRRPSARAVRTVRSGSPALARPVPRRSSEHQRGFGARESPAFLLRLPFTLRRSVIKNACAARPDEDAATAEEAEEAAAAAAAAGEDAAATARRRTSTEAIAGKK